MFASNIFFYLQIDYFDTQAHFKPLLHTWSLAVEEQFYIFFPLILWGLFAIGSRKLAKAFVLVTIPVSIALAVLVVQREPSLAFYMTPLRAWELLAGSVLALFTLPNATKFWRDLLSVAGILLAVVPVFTYTQATPFPGLAAIPPVLGACLLIYAGPGSVVGKLLSLRPMLFIGLISYSLYIWHWPLIVFADLTLIRDLQVHEKLGLFALMIGVATLSWRYIERPFRTPDFLRTRAQVFAVSGAAIAVASVVSAVFVFSSGLPNRLPPETIAIAAVSEERKEQRSRCDIDIFLSDTRGLCPIGAQDKPASVLIWGDSHAAAWHPMLDQILTQSDLGGYSFFNFGCPPAFGLQVPQRPACAALTTKFQDEIEKHDFKHVLIVGSWRGLLTKRDTVFEGVESRDRETRVENVVSASAATISALQASGLTVGVLMPVPGSAVHVPIAMSRQTMTGLSTEMRHSAEWYETTFADYRDSIAQADAVFHVKDVLCDAYCKVQIDGAPLYFDANHPSLFLNAHMAERLGPEISSFFQSPPAAD